MPALGLAVVAVAVVGLALLLVAVVDLWCWAVDPGRCPTVSFSTSSAVGYMGYVATGTAAACRLTTP